jgi:hypothetical protein
MEEEEEEMEEEDRGTTQSDNGEDKIQPVKRYPQRNTSKTNKVYILISYLKNLYSLLIYNFLLQYCLIIIVTERRRCW